MSNHPSTMQPAVFGYKTCLAFESTATAGVLEKEFAASMHCLVDGLKQAGCLFIGHIKALFTTNDCGHLMLSITSFDEPVRVTGDLVDGFTDGELSINIIAFGVEPGKVQSIFFKNFDLIPGHSLNR